MDSNLNKTSSLDKLKNKKVLAILAGIILLVAVGAIFLVVRGRGDTQSPTASIEEDLPSLSPEDIGMEVTVRSDKKAIMFELTKADDIKRVEYEIEYEKEIDGEIVPEGFIGEMNIADDGITKTDYWPFGTCSGSVCRYDENVKNIVITLKVEKDDGKIYKVVKEVQL